jgi:hypothetical protein
MIVSRARDRRKLVLIAVLHAVGAMSLGCSEPFPHRNPYDLEAPLELEVIALQDTAFAVEDIVVFQLVTQPAHSFSSVAWTTTRPDLLTSLGSGRFRLDARPPTTVTAMVVATVGARSASAPIVVRGL